MVFVSVIGDDGDDAACPGPLGAADGEEELHDAVVHWGNARLDDEHVFAVHAVVHLD